MLMLFILEMISKGFSKRKKGKIGEIAAKTDEKPKQVSAVAAVEAPAPAPAAPKETGDNFGDASYRQGYTDGQEAQCPISSTGGLAYAVIAKVEDKTE